MSDDGFIWFKIVFFLGVIALKIGFWWLVISALIKYLGS